MNIDPNIYYSLKNVLYSSGQFQTIAEMFRSNNESRIQAILESMVTGNIAQAERALHAIKGSCRMFGEIDCADSCERIEENLATSKTSPTPENIKELKRRLEEFWQFLKSESALAASESSKSVSTHN